MTVSQMTYQEYADAMRYGAKLYPHHKEGADLELTITDCTVCANGALIAGLSPFEFASFIESERENLLTSLHDNFPDMTEEEEVDEEESTELTFETLDRYYIESWTEMSHPLLWNRTVSCPHVHSVPWIKCAYADPKSDTFMVVGKQDIEEMIIHLYDEHLWTIEQVACWLEEL